MKTVGVLRAAGASTRFGNDDKLLVPLKGRALVTYAAEVLEASGCDEIVAATASPAVASILSGFSCVDLGAHHINKKKSLAAGLKQALSLGADRILVVLGDMPLVPVDTLRAVLEKSSRHPVTAASDGAHAMPPACFGSASFADILGIEGDKGGRDILRNLPAAALVICEPPALLDVDSVEDLNRVEDLLRNGLS